MRLWRPIWVESLLEVWEVLLEISDCCFTSKFNFEMEENELIVIVGPNGSGKTTFLRIILGTERIPCKILLNGENIYSLKPHERIKRGIVMAPSGSSNFPYLTVKENINLGLSLSNLNKKDKEKMLEEIYSIFPFLKDRRSQVARTLSGGEQRMLSIARALATNPKILLLDEPSFGLSPKMVDAVYDSILRIKKMGTSIIIAEQSVSPLFDYGENIDKVYFISERTFTFRGNVAELREFQDIGGVYFGLNK
ncbi:MAG: ATP-binding cassette domain-containing protein [Archaeoglobaceae archaeon]